jgi:hypothetical protein
MRGGLWRKGQKSREKNRREREKGKMERDGIKFI